MKNIIRRLLALCCAVIMLAVPILGAIAPANARAATPNTLSSNLKKITFSDFGIDDATYTTSGKEGTYAGASNLLGTVLCGKVSFKVGANQSSLIYIGGKDKDSSLLLRTYRNEIHMYTEPSAGSGYSNYIPKSTPYKFTAQNILGDKAVDGRFSALDADGKVNFELDLKISFESANVDNDATANDLKLGMWFNGTLYNNEYIYIEDYVDVMGTYLYVVGASHSWGGIITVESIVKEPEPTGLKEITFKDFGIDNGSYPTTGKEGTYTGAANLIGTALCGKVSFEVGANQSSLIYIGGKDKDSSLLLRTYRNEIHMYTEPSAESGYSNYIPKSTPYKFTAQNILGDKAVDGRFSALDPNGKVSFKLDLKITFESANVDNDTTANDLKLGMWFNGELYNNEYIYIEDYVDVMGTYLYVVGASHSWGGIITVESIVKEPEPTELKEITFKDFGIDNGSYPTVGKSGTYAGATNLIGTALCGNAAFDIGSGQSSLIYIGGKDEDSSLLLRTYRNEIHMYTEPSAESGYSNYIPKSTPYKFTAQNILGDKAVDGRFSALDANGKASFALDLKISFESANVDNDATANDLKLGMWFNGTLYNNEYIYIEDYVDVMGTYLHVVGASQSWGGVITIKSIGEEEPVLPEKMPEGLKHITFTDFDGVKEGTYTKNQSTNGRYSGDSLNGTVLEGKITFKRVSGGDPVLIIGGKKDKGHGLVLRTMKNADGVEGLRLYSDPSPANSITTRYFYSDVAGTTLVGKELNLKISFEYVNNDNGTTQNDLKLGMWFADKLYNNQYIYLNNYVDTEYALGTLFYACGIAGGSITLGEAPDEEIPGRLKEITFHDFEGFKDGAYTNNETTYGTYSGESLNGKVLAGTVTFKPASNANPTLIVGGKDEMKHGIVLQTAIDTDSGEHYLSLHTTPETQDSTRYSFYSETAGVPLVGEALNLRLSFQFVNNDGGSTDNDLKLGVWFDGKLYDNEYIYLNNYVDTAYTMGTYLYACGVDDSTITLESVKQETMPEGMTELSFWDFSINDGLYQNTKSATNPYYGDTLDKTVLMGKVTFSVPGKDGSALIAIGSKSKQWYGLTLKSYENPTTGETFLRLYDAQKRAGYSQEYYFYPEVAGVELVECEVDLKMSFEFVDQDGDNCQNDLKLGMWFGEKLYNNKYIYFHDYVDTNTTMGTYLTVYAPKGSSIIIESVETYNGEISYTTFGLTKDWQAQLLSKQVKLDIPVGGSHTSNKVPNTGDRATGWLWGVLSLGCFMTITLIRKKERIR